MEKGPVVRGSLTEVVPIPAANRAQMIKESFTCEGIFTLILSAMGSTEGFSAGK